MSTNFLGCQPVSQCCCGCSLGFATKFFLVLNLIRSVVYVFIGTDNIVHAPMDVTLRPEGGSLGYMLLLAGWGITGATLSLVGLWGIATRMDTAVRACWFFLAIEFVVDFCSNVLANWNHDGCTDIDVMLWTTGKPLICASERALWAIILVMATVLEGYVVYIVHCHCESMTLFGGLDKSFKELYHKSETGQSDEYCNLIREHMNSVSSSVGDSCRIYGTNHHIQYPPETSMGGGKLV
eukprot:TRINITY_DN102053_c0_g1_i1.p1 TRINITY_DN102053_c0_g1~~TRINITY_DN102053_c0_g1_i1.p1  ORF type:complete len:263 (-),score=34.13 TRINITY_DN102053_c0_g1_i1:45-758(-)